MRRYRRARFWMGAFAWSMAAAFIAAACGGDDNSAPNPTDGGGADATAFDATPLDARAVDTGSDAREETDASDAGNEVPSIDLGVVCGATPAAACAIQIGVGYYFGCGLFADGAVRCWGNNSAGEMGSGVLDGGTVFPTSVLPPTQVPGIHDVRQIASAAFTACALEKDGSVWCWGYNSFGETAQPDVSRPTITPAQVSLPARAVRLIPGYDDTCAVLEDHTVQCWGWSHYDQLGVAADTVSSPVRVDALENGAATGACVDAFFALATDGGISALGGNMNGQLGRGIGSAGLAVASTAAPVVGLPEPAIGVGTNMRGNDQCAILQDRTLACWGRNQSHQFGSDPDAGDVLFPRVLDGIDGVAEITSGSDYLCARSVDGGVSCWGNDDFDQCAVPPGGDVDTPTHVAGLGPIVEIVGSDSNVTCVLEVTGAVDCWGNPVGDQTGQLDAATPAYLPSRVQF